MKSFYFGRSDKPLYGVYHAPLSSVDRREGILLCNAFGQEYMRAHRAFRQLANLLTRKGYHVMRFDYYGTGDAAGRGTDATAEQWLADIGHGLSELKAIAHIESVSLIGLRLGGTLAGYLSGELDGLNRVVLWDPLMSGQHYIDEVIDYLNGIAINKERPPMTSEQASQGFYMNGFPLSAGLIRSLQGVDLEQVEAFKAQRYLLIVSSESMAFEQLRQTLAAKAKLFEYRLESSPGNWNFVDNFGGVLIPHAIIQSVVNWFDG